MQNPGLIVAPLTPFTRDLMLDEPALQRQIKVTNGALGYALNGWQVSGTVCWHSGVPFSVLSTPCSADGNGIVQGGGPQFASLVPGVDPYCRNCNIPGLTQPAAIQWLPPLCPRLIRLRGRATVATRRRTASSGILAVTLCAAPTSSGATSTSRNGSRLANG